MSDSRKFVVVKKICGAILRQILSRREKNKKRIQNEMLIENTKKLNRRGVFKNIGVWDVNGLPSTAKP